MLQHEYIWKHYAKWNIITIKGYIYVYIYLYAYAYFIYIYLYTYAYMDFSGGSGLITK